MNAAFLTAMTTKWAGSNLASDVGNRIYYGQAPDGTPFPYVVWFVVSDVPEYPHEHTLEEMLIQFSLYSTSPGMAEIANVLADLRALYDDCTLAIEGSTLVYFIRGNLTTMVDEITTTEGTQSLKHWAQEYHVCTDT